MPTDDDYKPVARYRIRVAPSIDITEVKPLNLPISSIEEFEECVFVRVPERYTNGPLLTDFMRALSQRLGKFVAAAPPSVTLLTLERLDAPGETPGGPISDDLPH